MRRERSQRGKGMENAMKVCITIEENKARAYGSRTAGKQEEAGAEIP
jgi:hypothetical protein